MGPSNQESGTGQLRHAFQNDFQALAFLVLVTGVLVSPVLIAHLHPQDRRHIYRTMREEDGGFSFMEHEIYEVKDNIDVVFIGPSTVWSGIDSPIVEKALTEKLGRPARVMTFGNTGASMDVPYMLMRDLLSHKRVGMVVTSVPRAPFNDGLTPQGFRFLSYSDPPETDGLPLRYRAMLYAGYVLRGPRDLLDWLRPAPSTASSLLHTNGAMLALAGWYGQPYTPFTAPYPQLPPEASIYSTRTRDNFSFSGAPLPFFQTYYLHKLCDLLRTRHVKLVLVSIPQYQERRNSLAIERLCWPDVLGWPTAMVGIPPATLFRNLSDQDVQKLYYDDLHLNRNGSEMLARTLTPALLELYANRSRVD